MNGGGNFAIHRCELYELLQLESLFANVVEQWLPNSPSPEMPANNPSGKLLHCAIPAQ